MSDKIGSRLSDFWGTLRCLIGLHFWEPTFRYVYGETTPSLTPVTEGKPYMGDPRMPRRKEKIVMQDGQARCSRCLSFRLPLEKSIKEGRANE